MPELYELIVVPEAQYDIREILLYIVDELAAPQAALSLNEDLRHGIKSLSFMPKRTKPIEEQPWGEMGVRKIRIRNYYIYYWIDEENKTIKIIAVIYTRMDQEEQLQKRQL